MQSSETTEQTANIAAETQTLTAQDEKNNDTWFAMYDQLKEYKKEQGDCLVPQRYKPNPKLGRWVNKQRENKDKSLSSDRIQLLESIGFTWSVVKREPWEKMFERLLVYKKKNGDCLVPQRYRSDPRLGGWVREQRKRKDHLSPQRRECLDAIGFTWRVKDHQQLIKDEAAAQFNNYVANGAQTATVAPVKPQQGRLSLPGRTDLSRHGAGGNANNSMFTSAQDRRFTLPGFFHQQRNSLNLQRAGGAYPESALMTSHQDRMRMVPLAGMRAPPQSSSASSSNATTSSTSMNGNEDLIKGLVETENDIRMNEMRMNDLRLTSLLLEKKRRAVLSAAALQQSANQKITAGECNNKLPSALAGFPAPAPVPMQLPKTQPTDHPWAA